MEQPYRIPSPPAVEPKEKFLKRHPGLIGGSVVILVISILQLSGRLFDHFVGPVCGEGSPCLKNIFLHQITITFVGLLPFVAIAGIGVICFGIYILAIELGESIYKRFLEKNSK